MFFTPEHSEGEVFSVSAVQSSITIGRGSSCDVVVDDTRVSRVHCEIKFTPPNTITVTDTSSNGTFHNEKLIGKSNSVNLKNGDLLSVVLAPEKKVSWRLSGRSMTSLTRSLSLKKWALISSLRQIPLPIEVGEECVLGRGNVGNASQRVSRAHVTLCLASEAASGRPSWSVKVMGRNGVRIFPATTKKAGEEEKEEEQGEEEKGEFVGQDAEKVISVGDCLCLDGTVASRRDGDKSPCMFVVGEEDGEIAGDDEMLTRIDTSATVGAKSPSIAAMEDVEKKEEEKKDEKIDKMVDDEPTASYPKMDAAAITAAAAAAEEEEEKKKKKEEAEKQPKGRGRKAQKTDVSSTAATTETAAAAAPAAAEEADGGGRSTRHKTAKQTAVTAAEPTEPAKSTRSTRTRGGGKKEEEEEKKEEATTTSGKKGAAKQKTAAAAAAAAPPAPAPVVEEKKETKTKTSPAAKKIAAPLFKPVIFKSPKFPKDFPLVLGEFTMSLHKSTFSGYHIKSLGYKDNTMFQPLYHEQQMLRFMLDSRVWPIVKFEIVNVDVIFEHGEHRFTFRVTLNKIVEEFRVKATGFGQIMDRLCANRPPAPSERASAALSSSPWQRPDSSRGEMDPEKYDVLALLEAAKPPPNAPEMVSPPDMTPLLSYQRKALKWMVAKESGEFDASFPPRLHPAYRAVETPSGFTIFQSLVEPLFFSLSRPVLQESSRGGVLADEMGLGKSVEVIALILSHRRPESDLPSTPFPPSLKRLAVPSAAEEGGGADGEGGGGARRSRRHAAAEGGGGEKDKGEEEADLFPIGATLLVAPQPIVQQWSDELEMHAGAALRVVRYNGMDMKTSGEDFKDADVVLTTYEALRKDLRTHSKTIQSPLLHVEWWRIVLDEAQAVCSSTSAVSQMSCAIARVNSWCVSGTPISNKINDLRGLVEFLNIEPFVDNAVWKHVVTDMVVNKTKEGVVAMRELVQSIMWRNRKEHVQDEIALPPSHTVEHWLTLSSAEKSFYDKHHNACRTTVLGGGGGGGGDANMMQQLLLLRQACCHPQVAGGAVTAFGGARLTMQQILEKLLQEAKAKHRSEIRDQISLQIKLGKVSLPAASAEPLLRDCREDAIKIARKCEEESPEEYNKNRFVYIKLQLKATNALLTAKRSRLVREGGGGDWSEVRDLERESKRLEDSLPKEEEILPSSREMREKTQAATKKSKQKEKVKVEESPESLKAGIERTGHRIVAAAHEVQHLNTRLSEFLEAAKGGAAAAGGGEGGGAAAAAGGGGGGATIVAANEDGTCPICLEVIECATVTQCGHVYCKDCIQGLVEVAASRGRKAPCPLCRLEIGADDLIHAMTREEEEELEKAAKGGGESSVEKANTVREYGTKIATLIEELKKIEAESPGTKSIVFSQWNRLIVLVMEALEAHDIGHIFMSGKQREFAVSTFRRDPTCRVLLLNMRNGSGAAGLTLTCANHAFLMEPSLNVAIEDQAAARVHRIGQRKPVFIHRLLIKNSIETGILQLQNRKKEETKAKGGAVASRNEQESLQAADLLKMFEVAA